MNISAELQPATYNLPGSSCKRCHSNRIIKSGQLQGNQRYQCKDCGCVFIANSAPFRGRLPVETLALVMQRFFTGEPLDSIRTFIEDSHGLPVSVAGLEKIIYRFARKAVTLTGNILPRLNYLWLIEGSSISAVRPICILDILDLDSGFIIASDVVPNYAERDRENVLQKAFRITGSTPQIVVTGPAFSSEYLAAGDFDSLPRVTFTPHQETNLLKYQDLTPARTQLIARRLNFDSLTNTRLISAAWRVNYNFFSDFKPAGVSPYNSWLEIINATETQEIP